MYILYMNKCVYTSSYRPYRYIKMKPSFESTLESPMDRWLGIPDAAQDVVDVQVCLHHLNLFVHLEDCQAN